MDIEVGEEEGRVGDEVRKVGDEEGGPGGEERSPGHRIKIHIEGPLTSEALKFLSSRMSHYACWPPFS
jgi:hypothetical protein